LASVSGVREGNQVATMPKRSNLLKECFTQKKKVTGGFVAKKKRKTQ